MTSEAPTTNVTPDAAPAATPQADTAVTPAPAPARWRAARSFAGAALVVIAGWGLDLWGLGKAPFHTKGEPREGLVVWQMTHQGGLILPRRDGPTGLEVPSKPPLFHWLAALTSVAHGATDEWSIRFPSAALSLIALLCVFGTGAALWGPLAGLASALTLMTMFEWARASTGARVDMTLTFGLQLAFISLLFFLRSRGAGWLIGLYAGITLAVLGKGPVGAVLPGLVALVMLALTRDVSFLSAMRLGYGTLVVGIGAGSWYVLALILGGWQFFRKQVLAENVFTFLNNQDFGGGHRHAPTYMLGALLLGVLPWTLFIPAVATRLWRQRRQISARDPRVYLLVWIVAVFAFYAFAASKRSVYLLSLYPAVALLLGWWWSERMRAPIEEDRWLIRALPFVVWTLLGILGILFVAAALESAGLPVWRVVQRWLPDSAKAFAPWISDIIRAQRALFLGLVLAAAAALYGCIRASRTASWAAIGAGVFGATAALIMSVSQVLLPGIAERIGFRDFMSDVRQVVGPTGELFFFKTFEYGAVFYWQGHIPSYEGPWPVGAPRYLLMDRDEWERIRPSVSERYERVSFTGSTTVSDTTLVLVRRIGE